MQESHIAARKAAVNRIRQMGFELIKSDVEVSVVEVATPAPMLVRALSNYRFTTVEVSGQRFADVEFEGIRVRWRA